MAVWIKTCSCRHAVPLAGASSSPSLRLPYQFCLPSFLPSPAHLFFLPFLPPFSSGLYQFITNFSETVENVSGPVAILAVGAEVARSNAAGEQPVW